MVNKIMFGVLLIVTAAIALVIDVQKEAGWLPVDQLAIGCGIDPGGKA